MAQLHIIPWNISRFTHNAEAKILYAEMSDFGHNLRPMFEQLYDDAADVGIAVYNYKTNSVTHWHTEGDGVRDADGDITHWVLRPTNESCRKHPGVQDYSIHILND